MKFRLRRYSFDLWILCGLPVLLAGAAVPRPGTPGGPLALRIANVSPGRAVLSIATLDSAKWKVLKDRKGFCQTSVPENWAAALPGMAIPPGGGTHAALSSAPGQSLGDVKEIAKTALKPTTVTEDTPTRYAFQYGSSGLHSYAARSFPGLVCAVEVDVSTTEAAAAMADDVKKIVANLDRVH